MKNAWKQEILKQIADSREHFRGIFKFSLVALISISGINCGTLSALALPDMDSGSVALTKYGCQSTGNDPIINEAIQVLTKPGSNVSRNSSLQSKNGQIDPTPIRERKQYKDRLLIIGGSEVIPM